MNPTEDDTSNVSNDPITETNPPVPPTTGSDGPNWKKRVLTTLLVLIIAGGAAFAVHSVWKPATSSNSSVSAKDKRMDIPHLGLAVIKGSINIYPTNATDSYSLAINNQIFEGLVSYENRTKIVPSLATGWTNPDSTTWVFNLRSGVKFHSGKTMTADDVVYSLKFAQTNEDLSVFSDSIKDVTAPSTDKVTITTKAIDPFFLNKLAQIRIISKDSAATSDTMNGTGPYELKPQTKPTETNLELVAFDGYHGGHVYTRAITYSVVNDSAAGVKGFKAGTYSFLGEISSRDITGLTKGTYQVEGDIDPSVVFLAVNSVSNGPLQKKAVREALRSSLDLNKLIKASGTDGKPDAQLMTQDIPGYNSSITIPERDVAKAKEELVAAGYPNGISLNLTYDSLNQKLIDEIVLEAKEANITINAKPEADFDTLIGNVIGGKIDLGLISFGSDVLDSSDIFTQVLQQTDDYKNPTLDDYLKQAASTTDQAKRLVILQKTSQLVYDDVAAIPLINRERSWLVNPKYNFDFDTLSGTPGIYFWKAYASE